MATFDGAIDTIMKHEGGFVDHPNDPGGATNYGITLRNLRMVGDLDGDGFLDGDFDFDGDVDADDIRKMTKAQAIHRYKTDYWLSYYSDILSQMIATKVFDMAVNMGHKQAHTLVQRALRAVGQRVGVDGRFGPKTLAAINMANPECLLAAIRATQSAFYVYLSQRKPKLKVFLNGWLRRANDEI